MKLKILGLFLLFVPLTVYSQNRQAWYTGNGGNGIRLAVLAPAATNLADTENWIPVFVQGILSGNFTKYSAITVIDRQNMDKILAEQALSAGGNFSDDNYIRMGNMVNAQNVLAGTIIKISPAQFALQFSVADTETGVSKASFNKTFSLAQITSGVSINEASAELLTQLGVNLTNAGKEALQSFTSSTVDAQTALAKGIEAQRSGTVVEAMTYYYQAANFDPSLLEAAGRLSTLSSNITGGNIGQNVRNDIQRRNAWLATLKESADYFKAHPPFEILYDPTLKQGNVDYSKETVTLSFNIALVPTLESFKILNDLLQGLEQTGQRNAWGLNSWPFSGGNLPADTVVFPRGSTSFKINTALINDDGKTIGTAGLDLSSKDFSIRTENGLRLQTAPGRVVTVSFNGVNANDITDKLLVKILSINNISAEQASARGFIKISTFMQQQTSREHPIVTGRRSATRNIFFDGTSHWYKIESQTGGQITLFTESGLDTYITLYDNNRRKIAEDDDSGNGGNARISSNVSGGTLLIEVKEYHKDTGFYSLIIE